MAAMIVAALTEPLFAALMKPLLDQGFVQKTGFAWWIVPSLIVGVFIVRGLATFLANYAQAWANGHVQTDLRVKMFSHLMRLPASSFQEQASATVVSKLVFDVSNISDCVGRALIVLVRDTAVVIGLVSWLLWLNWRLTLVVLVLLPVLAFVVSLFSKRLRNINRSGLKQIGELNRVGNEALSAYKAVKVYGAYGRQNRVFEAAAQRWRNLVMKNSVATGLATPISQIFAAIALAVVVSLALNQAGTGQTSVGGFVSFVTAMLMLFTPLKHLADVNTILQQGLASAESVFSVLDQAPEADLGTATITNVKGEIRFENVCYRYPKASSDALSGVDLHIEPGQIVAFVGVSGAGKTSVMNLVPRFFSPTQGRILLDGVDIESLTLASLRTQIALVSQEIILFNDSVAANIAFGLPDGIQPTDEQLMRALDKAALGDWVRQQPEQLQTMIGEGGSKLSGGQRQRLAIARALVKDAPILLLDEATSALDVETEREVQSALEAGMQGRTTLVIAHRLSTIAKADKIVVFEAGRIVEQGTAQALMEKNGVYARLQAASQTS